MPFGSRAELFAVDLTLRYHEDLAQGQRTMFRHACGGDAQPCGYSRIVERPCVHLDVVKDLRVTPEDRDAIEWERDFRVKLEAYIKELRAALLGRDAGDVVRYVRQHPLATLCFVEDYVCCIREQDKAGRANWRGLVGEWLLLDWILQQLRCDCWSCRPDAGVRIARVLLRRIKVRAGVRCRVVMIDSGPRFRRALHKACRPIRTGAIDLAPYLWQPVSDVCTQLVTRGVKVPDVPPLRKSLMEEVFTTGLLAVEAGRAISPVVMEDPLGVPRVAAFVAADGTP